MNRIWVFNCAASKCIITLVYVAYTCVEMVDLSIQGLWKFQKKIGVTMLFLKEITANPLLSPTEGFATEPKIKTNLNFWLMN